MTKHFFKGKYQPMKTKPKPDLNWDDTEIVFTEMTPDTKFVFDHMTLRTLSAVDAQPEEEILDLACGRAIDAFHLAMRGAKVFGLEPSSVMIKKALEWVENPSQHPVILVRALAEKIPFADNSFDKVVCKGAMDHFVDLDATFAELARIIKPSGKLIISIANFESLSCKLGRIFDWLYEKIKGKKRVEHPFWLPPKDHNYKFDYPFLKKQINKYFQLEKIEGLSLLWGFPYWGEFLEKLPAPLAQAILKFLDLLARIFPPLSDVLIAQAVPKNQ